LLDHLLIMGFLVRYGAVRWYALMGYPNIPEQYNKDSSVFSFSLYF
jgi:hypothetical protein